MALTDSFMGVDSQVAMERIRPYILETPVVRSSWLSEKGGANVYLKLENRQDTGSFKLRGAASKLLSLSPEQRKRGVVTASNGNYGFGIASMSTKLGIDAEVFVAEGVAQARVERLKKLGARVRKVKGYLEAELAARKEAETSGRIYAPPYNDPDVVAGQGTIAVELLKQLPKLDAVFVTCGGGGLIGGIGLHMKAHSPQTDVVGCWAANSPVMYECLRAGRILPVHEEPTYAVSAMGNIEEGSITFPIAQRVIGTKVIVSEEEILAALRNLHKFDGQTVEGAAALAAAAYLQAAPGFRGRTVAILLCGGNADPALLDLIYER